MYSEHENIQILVSLLKQYGISNIVISPGSRHVGFVNSVEYDDFFKTYSIVDERSAAFFAIGLIQKTGEPAVVCCTSGTAACNYVSAMAEAFYRHLPLIVVSADKDEVYLKKHEDQLIPQIKLYEGICKKSVTLPKVNNAKDFEYCSLLVNEALIELNHHGSGPVHINFLIEEFGKSDMDSLPDVRKIDVIDLGQLQGLEQMVDEMRGKRILLLYGHTTPLCEKDVAIIDEFGTLFDCVIATEKESNLHTHSCIETYSIAMSMTNTIWNDIRPDIVITMYGIHFNYPIREILNKSAGFEHWFVCENGELVDTFNTLKKVIEMSPVVFFEKCVEIAKKKGLSSTGKYLHDWKTLYKTEDFSLTDYSSIYAIQQFLGNIPKASNLHVGNGMMSSYIQPFALSHSVQVYRNEATTGIDGCMSTFVGQSIISENLCFMLIGDLSFFYDMNILGSRYIKPNMRIMVINNFGGETMYHAKEAKNMTEKEMDNYVCARHQNSVKAWGEDNGFLYLDATNKEEFDEALVDFLCNDSWKPIIFEVFTEKEKNLEEWRGFIREKANKLRYRFVKAECEYLVYGAGKLAQGVKEEIERRGGVVTCFADSMEKKWNTKYLGKDVIPPNDILSLLSQVDKIVIGTIYVEEVRAILNEYGIPSDKIEEVV